MSVPLPPAPSGFRWRDSSLGPRLECLPLRERADHAFTTRALPGAATVQPPSELWVSIAREFGVEEGRVVRARQVHGRHVELVRRSDEGSARHATPADADAIAGDDCRSALTVRVADCVPILLASPGGGVVAAVHAGWRGMAGDVIAAAVRTMAATWSLAPADLVAAVGPSIGPCCYQVGPEVARAFAHAGHDAASRARWFRPDVDDRLRLDLWGAARDRLVALGLGGDAVHVSRLCTACHLAAFFSYRVEGPRAGRLMAIIRATRPSPRSPGGPHGH